MPLTFVRVLLLAIAVVLMQAPLAKAHDLAQFDLKSGLLRIARGGAPMVQGSFVFWSGQWRWNTPGLKTDVLGPLHYQVTSRSKPGEFNISAIVKADGPRRVTWTFVLDPGATADLFGGISFRVDRALMQATGSDGIAEFTDDGTGWSLALAPGSTPIKVSVEPKPVRMAFERKQPEEIRVYFGTPEQPLAAGTYKMTVELPDDLNFEPTTAERLAQPSSDWYDDLLTASDFPVDLSYLNASEKPAGKRGFLAETNGQLAFADGTRARFWGANLTAYALFHTSQADTVRQAKRLSKLGFNLVRIHHLDSAWVKPNIIASDGADGVKLDQAAMRSLDWWIKALSDEGIYVWFDLNNGRIFSPEGLEAVEEINQRREGPSTEGFAYLNASVEAKMRELNALILSHVNAYTGLAYADDPSIAFYLITNENDLTHHFGNAFLPDKKRPFHSGLYMAAAGEFAATHGFDANKVWRSWEFGPSKLFLGDMEHRFNARMIAHLHSKGAKVPIVTTSSFGKMSVAGLPSLTDGGAVAVHSYADRDILEKDPRLVPNLLSWMTSAGVAGKPLAVPEWNTADYPSHERAALPPYLAAVAALQDWDAMLVYAYSQQPLAIKGQPSVWEVAFDPAALSAMTAAALIYRESHVRRDPVLRYIAPTSGQFIDQPLSPVTSKTIRTLTESGRYRLQLPALPELPWFKPRATEPGAEAISDMQADYSAPGNSICAETGDFCRDWEDGIFKLDTEKSKLAAGWIGGREIELSGTEIAVSTAYASVAVQSLDQVAIAKSKKILVSLAAQTVPPAAGSNATRSEPVTGRVSIAAEPGLQAFALFGNGVARKMESSYEDGRYVLNLDHRLKSLWIMLAPP